MNHLKQRFHNPCRASGRGIRGRHRPREPRRPPPRGCDPSTETTITPPRYRRRCRDASRAPPRRPPTPSRSSTRRACPRSGSRSTTASKTLVTMTSKTQTSLYHSRKRIPDFHSDNWKRNKYCNPDTSYTLYPVIKFYISSLISGLSANAVEFIWL